VFRHEISCNARIEISKAEASRIERAGKGVEPTQSLEKGEKADPASWRQGSKKVKKEETKGVYVDA
jgi:hypothetical protein